ncbi:hypothetical protein T440DRAFT_477631 [Plenodomus tracheiphilus IPT5]|uniref:Uncharacterized protein n=1 Tax=Plenodomus tracheiphilus IPT5 TaxID=1408161 RepID=A0A6A7BBT6_9PLEO|nr:hypothetical protein T440DRAFT_477631 [Plenodomus tracheiphilus IPT5]
MAQTTLRLQARPTAAYLPAETANNLTPCAQPKAQIVTAQEIQARIKAARRKKAASQTPPVTAHLNPRQSRTSYLGVAPGDQLEHSIWAQEKSHGPLCIDAVMKRLQMETREPKSESQHGRPVHKNHTLQIHGDAFAIESPPAHRPQTYRTTSSRSSIVSRKSPLSTVSLPDDSSLVHGDKSRAVQPQTELWDLPALDFSRSSSQSSTTKYIPINGPSVTLCPAETLRPKFYKKNNDLDDSTITSTLPRSKSRMSWLSLNRKSHVSAT